MAERVVANFEKGISGKLFDSLRIFFSPKSCDKVVAWIFSCFRNATMAALSKGWSFPEAMRFNIPVVMQASNVRAIFFDFSLDVIVGTPNVNIRLTSNTKNMTRIFFMVRHQS